MYRPVKLPVSRSRIVQTKSRGSGTKFNNPLVTSYGVKAWDGHVPVDLGVKARRRRGRRRGLSSAMGCQEAPWLLLFAQGELVFSNQTADGGYGDPHFGGPDHF